MDSYEIRATNTFGIGSLSHTFDISASDGKGRCVAIYAPNGTCKSSLRKALTLWSQGKEPRDCFFPNRTTSFEIKSYPKDSLSRENVFCFKSMGDLETAQFFDNDLLASPELKKRYADIVQSYEKQKDDLLAAIRSEIISGRGEPKAAEIETLILETAGAQDFYESLALLRSKSKTITFPNFLHKYKMNELLGKSENVLEKSDIKESLVDFAQTRAKVAANSGILNNMFDYPAAVALLDVLKKSDFFTAGHGLIIRDRNTNTEQVVNTVNDFSTILSSELEKADNNPEVIAKYKIVEKAFGSAAGPTKLKKYACSDPEIAVAFSDVSHLKRSYILYAIARTGVAVDSYLSQWDNYKKQMASIAREVNSERTEWDAAVDLFKSRFAVPFELNIADRANVIVGGKDPIIDFKYEESDVDTKVLIENMSEGERKALYMLSIIFEVEKAKKNAGAKLLVFDDVVDSFDYANKYAFIEYLRDFSSSPDIYVLLLTHNFDFFRTISSRLRDEFSRTNCVLAEKDDRHKIIFSEVGYLNHSLIHSWRGKLDDDAIKIACIPMVRELLDIQGEQDSAAYTLLSSILHGRDDATDVRFSDLDVYFKQYWNCDDLAQDSRFIFHVIHETCDKVASRGGHLKLQEKIVLSIGIRIMAEHYINSEYSNAGIDKPAYNQLGRLIRALKSDLPNSYKSFADALEQASLIVPENIHINAFMYEPLVDIGSRRFIDLFYSCKCFQAESSTAR